MPTEQMKTRARRWATDAPIPSFVIQSFLSTFGAILIGTVTILSFQVALAAVTKNTSGGNFADHVTDQPLGILYGEPYFISPILAGLVLGALSHRVFRGGAGLLTWVVPTLFLACGVFAWKNGGLRPYWPDVWNNYFGSGCGSSECGYEFLVTQPFYTSVAYALGVVTGRWRLRKKGA